jgi:hypothetical protein
VILITIWWLQAAQKFDVMRFNLKNLSDPPIRKLYKIGVSIRFADLCNLNDREGINRAWENIKEYFKTSGNDSLGVDELKHINHGLMKNIYDFSIKGSRPKCSGYRIQTKTI